MKPGVLRDLPLDELRQKHDELEQEYFGLRIKHALGQLENPLVLRSMRRDIARTKTLLRENGITEFGRRRRETTAAAPKKAAKKKRSPKPKSESKGKAKGKAKSKAEPKAKKKTATKKSAKKSGAKKKSGS